MKMRSLVVICSASCLALLHGISVADAQGQSPAGADKIKALLLRPAGWIAHWSKPGDEGVSEIVFEARGDKVVAKIQNVTHEMTCEKNVTITLDIVKFDGCIDWDITLRFDPKDKRYPFKGKSGKFFDYKVQAK